MSEVLYQTACPFCRSSDAYTHYDDGHTFCYSCKKGVPSTQSIEDYRKRLELSEHTDNYCKLPEDFDYNIHQKGLDWLKKYSLTNKEIVSNRLGWSEEGVVLKKTGIKLAPLLIFPVFDQVGHLLMWQGRNFGEVGPKYYTKGNKDILHILGEGDTIVLTEDLISAIKVSRLVSAMPVWGSFVESKTARRLSQRFNKCAIWLDKDKAKESFKQAQTYSYMFKEGCFCIRSERDPKEYTTQEIQEYLK